VRMRIHRLLRLLLVLAFVLVLVVLWMLNWNALASYILAHTAETTMILCVLFVPLLVVLYFLANRTVQLERDLSSKWRGLEVVSRFVGWIACAGVIASLALPTINPDWAPMIQLLFYCLPILFVVSISRAFLSAYINPFMIIEYGKIIFLNGASSSGKSTLAKELQQLEETYMHMALDDVWATLPEKVLAEDEWYKKNPLAKYGAGFLNSVAGYSKLGFGVIIEDCCCSPRSMKECLELFKDTRVIFVEVICSVSEMKKREETRGDRMPGQGEAQLPTFEKFRSEHIYDLQVDTSVDSASECAERIIEMLNDETIITAFEQMRERNC
jgi:chloramphenicol 3-O phosphotransferase